MTLNRRGRTVALAVIAALLVVLVVLAVRALGGGDGPPPAADAAKVAPDTTLVLLDVSTDGKREAVQKLNDLLGRFASYAPQRAQVLRRLSGAQGDVDLDRDVKPWLGDEAALAFTDTGTGTAGSLVMIRVTDEDKARAFMRRNPKRTATGSYRGDPYEEYARLTVAVKDGWLLIGQSGTVRNGLDAINGRGGPTLATQQAYRRAVEGLPADRVATLYASSGGLRRVLVPMGGLVGGVSVLFDQPALQSLALAVEPAGGGAKITARSALDAKQRTDRKPAFKPSLAGDVPQDAMAFLDVNGISGPLGRVLAAAAGGADAGGVGAVLARLQQQLQKQTGGDLERNLLKLFDGESGVVALRATPAPVVALLTRTGDEDATAKTLAQLEQPLVGLLTPKGEKGPAWRTQDLGDGVTVHTLQLPTGAGISYAVFGERLVIATSPEGVRRIKDGDGGLDGTDRFKNVLGGRPDQVGALGFLDFSQLLELGEQTGLNDNRAYLAARDDLQKIRAVGVSSTGDEDETTSEIRLSIP